MVSKSVWNLPGGPWERLFAGVWNNFNVAVYENVEKTLLTTIFPKVGEVNWIMIRVDRILIIPDKFEKIEKKLSGKDYHILKQKVPDRHLTYMILLSPPTTVEFGSKEIGSTVFQKVVSLNEEVEEIKNIARKEKVEVIDLKDAPYKESANILGNPTTLLSLLSIAPQGEEPRKERLKDLVIGEVDEELFKVSEEIFYDYSSIKKGTGEERNYLAQVLVEEAIIDVSPIPLILDYGKYPLKLDQTNPYPYNYEKYGFEQKAISFEIKRFDIGDGDCPLRIDLAKTSPHFAWKLFGLGKDEVSTHLLETLYNLQKTGDVHTLDDLEKGLSESKARDEVVKYDAIRIARAIKKAYGGIFGKSDTQNIAAEWIKNNQTAYIDMSSLNHMQRLAFTLYILECIALLDESRDLSSVEKKRLEYIYPIMLDWEWFGSGIMQEEILTRIIQRHKGALFVTADQLPMQLEGRTINRFNIISPRRAKLYIGGRGKEFDIRPLLSCPP